PHGVPLKRATPRPTARARPTPAVAAGVGAGDTTSIRLDYYLAHGAFHFYALACADDTCATPLDGACGAGTLTVTAYGPGRANEVLYSGDYSGCTTKHKDTEFPAATYY